MFYNLKIAIRNLRRNGMYSIINVSGLAVGLAACILITLWVWDELSYDRFHKNGKTIYRVLNVFKGNADYWRTSPAPLAAFMQSDISQIDEYCRIGDYSYQTDYLDYNNTQFKDVSVLAVDTSFFNMFSFPLIEGDLRKIFPDDLSLIISESKAKTIFGDENPVGKILKSSNDFAFHVTGVMKDIPEKSSIKADFIVRFDVQQRTFKGNGDWKKIEEDWGSYQYETYFKLAVGSNPEIIAEKMAKKGNDENKAFRLQPMLEMHLYTLDGQPAGVKTVQIFSVIALLILVIACINYVNMVTARANKRSREMGVRKIVGAKKSNLMGQLMGEVIVILFVALMLSTFLIWLVLPLYNEIAGKHIHFNLFEPEVILIYVVSFLITLLLSGLYPALSLASFRPMVAFRTVTSGRKTISFRKILVIVQFTFSIGLIIATIVIQSQLHYMQTKNKGYDKENIFTVHAKEMGTHFNTVKERLLSESAILDVSASGFDKMINMTGSRADIWKDKDGQWPIFHWAVVDTGFFSLMNIPLVEGRNFANTGSDNPFLHGVIVNETAARLIGKGESVISIVRSKFSIC